MRLGAGTLLNKRACVRVCEREKSRPLWVQSRSLARAPRASERLVGSAQKSEGALDAKFPEVLGRLRLDPGSFSRRQRDVGMDTRRLINTYGEVIRVLSVEHVPNPPSEDVSQTNATVLFLQPVK